jgi:uracil-DNA glycosylase
VNNRLDEPLAAVLDRAPASWAPLVRAWRDGPAGRQLEAFVASRQADGATIYPGGVLRALELTPLDQVRVVILGQDPYHGPGQAEGLAFSVPRGQRLPPSLRNVFKEIQRDVGLPMPAHGHLAVWAQQGVLLLNTVLTVEQGRPAGHAKRGWEVLTDEIIDALSCGVSPKAFMLWGAHAQSKSAVAQGGGGQHLVLSANHPSPLSASRGPVPFLGCGHFSEANRFLAARGFSPIDWSLGERAASRCYTLRFAAEGCPSG